MVAHASSLWCWPYFNRLCFHCSHIDRLEAVRSPLHVTLLKGNDNETRLVMLACTKSRRFHRAIVLHFHRTRHRLAADTGEPFRDSQNCTQLLALVMTRVDRYIVFEFLRVFVICFATFLGLFVVADFVNPTWTRSGWSSSPTARQCSRHSKPDF